MNRDLSTTEEISNHTIGQPPRWDDTRYVGVRYSVAADFLDSRVAFPILQRQWIVGPELRNPVLAFFVAYHCMRQDQPLFTLIGTLAYLGMVESIGGHLVARLLITLGFAS